MNLSLCQPCNVLADVGCDHAYLSINAIEGNVARHAVAMDLREGPLKKAVANIAASGLEDRIETRLSDGLDGLEQGEADCIVISGMGGITTCSILENGRNKLEGVKCLVLQPQSDLAMVRHYLEDMGYYINKEEMCFEDGKYYTCMRAVPSDVSMDKRDIFYEYGKNLLETRNPVLESFLEERKRKLEMIKTRVIEECKGNIEETLKHIYKEESNIMEATEYMKGL